jgi:DNA-3-methyladenine glycosylase
MFGPPGMAYIYFTYGMHWCLNVVCMAEGFPAAVLLRAIQPMEGLDLLRAHRPNLAGTTHWLDGPAKLTQAFGIDKRLNETDLLDSQGELMIEKASGVSSDAILTGPRIGLFSVPEPWKSIPWRFWYNYSTK